MSDNLGDTTHSVNKKIPISVCARQVANSKAIKSMYPKWVSWSDMPHVMTDITWSPAHFKNCHRKIENFETAQVIAFDFDSGAQSVDGMIDILSGGDFTSFLGVTKSHQLPKGPEGLIADRFRVALLMESATSDPDLYRQQLQAFGKIWATNGVPWFDKSCVEPSRLFYACKEIVFSHIGEALPWVKKAPPRKYVPVSPAALRDFSRVPAWVFRRVKVGNDGLSRHSIAYSVAACLAEYGFELEEIVDFVMSGYISEIGEKDVREAVWYGFNKTKPLGGRTDAIAFIGASRTLRGRTEGGDQAGAQL